MFDDNNVPDRDEMKAFLKKLISKDGPKELKKLLGEADEGYERTMTASNILFMLTCAITEDGLGKVLEDIRGAVSGFEEGCEIPDKDAIMRNWHAMLECVERLIEQGDDNMEKLF